MALVSAAAVQAKPCTTHDRWVGQDKTQHFWAGAAMAAGVTLVTQDAQIGFWTSSAVALAKELVDQRNPMRQCSLQDFLATVAGAGVGAAGARLLIVPTRGGMHVVYQTRF